MLTSTLVFYIVRDFAVKWTFVDCLLSAVARRKYDTTSHVLVFPLKIATYLLVRSCPLQLLHWFQVD